MVEQAADETEGEEPTDAIELSSAEAKTMHDYFSQVADSIPDFGGFYINGGGQPVVFLRSPDQHSKTEVAQVLKEVMGENILERGGGPRRSVQNPELTLREGAYSMEELLSWYEELGRVFSIDQVVFTDLQESTNSLTVGVTSLEVQADVKGIAEENEIPPEAVSVVQAELPEEQNHGLRTNVNPPRGGIEIGYPIAGADNFSACTLGFVGYLNGDLGYITNSHCTAKRGSVTGQAFNNPVNGPQLGVEETDPNYSTCGFFQNSACRYSDAAFVDFDSGINGVTAVAKTQSWAGPNSGSGSLKLSHGSASMDVRDRDKFPAKGEMVDKVGRTTGWTYGYVKRTCYNTRVGKKNSSGRKKLNGKFLLMKCQNKASYNSSSGDSGSPVFHWHGDEVTLLGVHWGGSNNAIFSSIGGIYADF